ncbi:hypothetical protein HPB49_011123 [Dermacentor silvarum]|uniref:Uncharacterized protein n=1 Tax=Dermacentor silvarum TaxID=543639 RepID=A0ACB8C341_DERSI|nr:hypothetical protein HPB49_011123 [Dermacentor silvarum]
MPRCFVTGCKSGYDSARGAAEKRHFFKPPNDASRLQEWQHAIPRSDKDRTSSCVMCDLHFQEEDIVKNFVHKIGDVAVIPRDKWSLKDDALPRLFPNCPRYLSKHVWKRKALAVRPPLQPKHRNVQDDTEQENTAPNTFDYGKRGCSVAGSVALDSNQSLFEELSTMAEEGRRVQGWSIELVGSTVVLYKLEVENAVPRVGKAVTFSSDFRLSVSANGRLVPSTPSTVYTGSSHLEVKSFSDLTCLLSHVEKLKSCQGFPAKLYPQISSWSVASKDAVGCTAVGIKLYREAKVPGMENSEGTETFTRMVNDLFDVLNIKLPSRGVRRHSKEIQLLKAFLEMLNTTEQNSVKKNLKLFASQQTTQSLRVTLLSTIDIIEYLLAQGAHYVLTAKLNQDPSERHFGLARSFGGDESHPNVVNFSQTFRLHSLYTPIKTALRGNVQGTPCSVLLSVTDTLKRTKDAHQKEKVRLHDIMEAKMMEITSASADASKQGPSDHAYYRGDVEDTVVYYLCGYVIHKFTKHTTCHLCTEDISSATPVLASDSYLTDYRSFKQGSLKHPTQKMLTFMKIANKIISACLDKEGLCGDIFWKVLEELEEHQLSRLGCDQHNAAFTCQVLNFFVITHMHFYSRDVNRRLGSSEKVAIANKKAHLL